MKRVTVSLIAALGVFLLAACGGDKQRATRPSTDAIVAVPTPKASATAVPAPLLNGGVGWLVYLRGRDLYAGSLADGSEVRLTTGQSGSGFAGYTYAYGDIGTPAAFYTGAPVVYYSEFSDPESGSGSYGTVVVYRQTLGSRDAPVRLFRFTGARRDLTLDSWSDVSISSNGRSLSYADRDGIFVYDTVSGVANQVLRNTCDPKSSGIDTTCEQYAFPRLSPDGRTLLATRSGHEFSYGVLVQQVDSDPTAVELAAAGSFGTWSPSGRELCASGPGRQPDKVGLLSPSGVMVRDLTSRLSDLSLDQALNAPRSALDCVWDDHECVAIPFSDFEPHDGVQRWRVAVMGLSRGGCPDRAYDVPEPYHSISAWLPGGSGMVISGYGPCVPCGERDPVNAVLLLDGTVRRLPFETGIVVGAIPPVPPPKDD